MKIGLSSTVALCVLSLATSASAQAPAPATTTTRTTAEYTEQRIGSDEVYTFPGEALRGDVHSAYGFTIRRPPGVLRANLIRPRVNFVSEMLKSVENL